MTEAFLYGAAYAGGVCLVLAVFILTIATAVKALEKVMARRYHQMIRETLAEFGEEDLEVLLRRHP